MLQRKQFKIPHVNNTTRTTIDYNENMLVAQSEARRPIHHKITEPNPFSQPAMSSFMDVPPLDIFDKIALNLVT